MSAIRSALDEMFTVDDSVLSAEELASDVVELSHVAQMVEVLRARKTKSLVERGGHNELGYSSPTAFLVDQTKVSPGHAKRLVGFGNAQEKAPNAYAAWADGRLSTDQVCHLFRAAEAVPDEYPDAEERLVEIVEGLDAMDTGKAIAYWRQAMEGPDELGAETQGVRRGVSASWTLGGMLRVDGYLTTTAGQAFMAGLDANTPPRHHHATATPAPHDNGDTTH